MKPTRKITNHAGNTMGRFPSMKMGRGIGFESKGVLAVIRALEVDQNVIFYCEQPEKIPYVVDGKMHHYTPDFRVIRYSGRPQIIEVKPEWKTKKAEFKAFVRRIRRICQARGEEFIVVTEKTFRAQPRLENLEILHRYSRTAVSERDQIVLNAFLSKGQATIAELEGSLASRGITRQKIFALVYMGFLSLDINKALGPQSRVSLKGAIHEKVA